MNKPLLDGKKRSVRLKTENRQTCFFKGVVDLFVVFLGKLFEFVFNRNVCNPILFSEFATKKTLNFFAGGIVSVEDR